MYLDISVNRRPMIIMVVTDATHNFVSMKEVKILGLTLEKEELHMKAVNSKAKSIYRLAQDVAVKVGSWLEKANFSVALMDNFNIFFGIELMCKVKMVPISHLMTIGILDEKALCMFPS